MSGIAAGVQAYLNSGAAAGKPTHLKMAMGQWTSVAAVDTIVTGLATVLGAVASYETDVADANFLVQAEVGDQAGTPAAGSILIKSWQNTTGSDPTPVAAAAFSKKINWIAWGT